uniref:Uncharacterized protein n=1 Tax=Plectus sambesii TaxID=2011161 RepID=A0A914XRR4_9BILA
MLLRLIAVSLVMLGCASEVLGAKFNCTATGVNINECLWKPENENTWYEFSGRMQIRDMSAVTFILKKQNTDGCIQKSTWKDVQAWIKIQTPPKPLLKIYKSLTEEQKTTVVGAFSMDYEYEYMQKVYAVYDFVAKKQEKLSKANAKKVDKWYEKRWDACKGAGPF